MSEREVTLSNGPVETVLPEVPRAWSEELERALATAPAERHGALAGVAGAHPTYLAAWAYLSAATGDAVEAYAYARVGYHRGLDQLRAAGWRGTGYLRWRSPTNQGFLRALEQLRRTASMLGEGEEAQRCGLFLRQLDPEWAGLPEQ